MNRGGAALLLAAVVSLPVVPSRAQGAPEERTYSSAHFSITWQVEGLSAPDPTDADADGIPDGVSRMTAAFEAARTFLLDELGYKEPPGDGLYPLYVSGDSDGSVHELPGGTGRSKPSFVVVPPKFVSSSLELEWIKAFAVHEYHHAIQIGYDSEEAFWVREATSSWLEDVFVDELDPNHHYLRWSLPYPQRSLMSADGAREYGAFLFLQFLVERYGAGDPAIVRELWEEMAVPEAIAGAADLSPAAAVAAVLERRSVTSGDAWGEYLLWQRHLSLFEEGSSYRGAVAGTGWKAFASSRRVRRESCRIDAGDGRAEPFSGEYARFYPHPRSKRSSAIVAVKGPPSSTGFYAVKPLGEAATRHRFTFDEHGVAQVVVPFTPDAVKKVALGLGHTAARPVPLAYSLRVDRTRTTVATLSGPKATTFFTPISLMGTIRCSGAPAPFAEMLLTATELGSGRVSTTAITSDAEGSYRLSLLPEAKTTYEVTLVDPLLAPISPQEHVVDVRVHTSLDVPDDPVEGLSVTVSGDVAPPHPGSTISIQFRRPEGDWRPGPVTTLGTDGRYSVEMEFPRDGVWQIRALAEPGDDDHSAGLSATRVVRLL